MKIIFVVNTTGLTGGIRAILIHANNLVNLGHEVEIVHLLRLKNNFLSLIIAYLKKCKYFIFKIFNINPLAWFGELEGVKIKRLIKLNKLKDFDCIIATANETADFVSELSADQEKKFYFVQDYEIWTRKKEEVDNTYQLPLKKIVISSYLKKLLLEKFNQETLGPGCIGFEAAEFIDQTTDQNNSLTILMPYHVLQKKGSALGLKVLEKIKQEFPFVKIVLFGPYKIKDKINFDFKHFLKPTREKLVKIFCSADIFLFPSLQEGFPAPPLEAMAAGCAVVATKVGTIPEYAKNNETAILVEPNDPVALYEALKDLILDQAKLKLLKNNAKNNITVPSWFKASQELENILITELKR